MLTCQLSVLYSFNLTVSKIKCYSLWFQALAIPSFHLPTDYKSTKVGVSIIIGAWYCDSWTCPRILDQVVSLQYHGRHA